MMIKGCNSLKLRLLAKHRIYKVINTTNHGQDRGKMYGLT